MPRVLGLVLVLLLAGCAGGLAPPPLSSADDARQRCVHAGHWWRPDVAGGYCEKA